MKKEPFVIERVFQSPASQVWKALTDKDDMKKWYFDLSKFRPESGFEFQFYGGTPEKQYLHLCKISEVIPEKKLSYSWRYEGYEGFSIVTFELFPDGNSTKLKLTHSGIETFPSDDPNFAEKSFESGWTYIIGTSLKDFLEKIN